MKSPELAAIPDPETDAAYFKCLDPLEIDEGGYAHVPGDHGGETNVGITQRIYDLARDAEGLPRQSVKLISDEEITAIYFNWYWKAFGCDTIPSIGFAFCVFQACVNMAPPLVKRIREGSTDMASFLAAQMTTYRTLAKQPDQLQFLNGWLARVAKTRTQAADLESAA